MNSSLTVIESNKSLKVLEVCAFEVLTCTMGKEFEYATFAHVMQLKISCILCWNNVPYTCPLLEIRNHHRFRT